MKSYSDNDWTSHGIESQQPEFFLTWKQRHIMPIKKTKMRRSSSTEAENISASTATQKVMWLLSILNDLELPQQLLIAVCEDNISA